MPYIGSGAVTSLIISLPRCCRAIRPVNASAPCALSSRLASCHAACNRRGPVFSTHISLKGLFTERPPLMLPKLSATMMLQPMIRSGNSPHTARLLRARELSRSLQPTGPYFLAATLFLNSISGTPAPHVTETKRYYDVATNDPLRQLAPHGPSPKGWRAVTQPATDEALFFLPISLHKVFIRNARPSSYRSCCAHDAAD